MNSSRFSWTTFLGKHRNPSSMGYLTTNTQSNRVVITSSVITRIFFNSVQCLDSQIPTYSNKDTCDLFILSIAFMCQLNRALFSLLLVLIIVVSLFCSIIRFSFVLCSTFVLFDSLLSFTLHCLLFKEKDLILILDCIPGISILL